MKNLNFYSCDLLEQSDQFHSGPNKQKPGFLILLNISPLSFCSMGSSSILTCSLGMKVGVGISQGIEILIFLQANPNNKSATN